MSDFRGMPRGPPSNVMRPIGPGPMMNPGPIKQPIFPTLCPDFMKGVCSVFQCPKNHPEASLLFCQPYQRDCCQAGQACTYMHATAEEEQYYKDTGLIPLRFMHKPIRMERGKGCLPNGQPSLFPTENSNTPTTPVEPQIFTPPPPVIAPEPIIMTPEVMPVISSGEKHKSVEPDPPTKRQKLSYEEIDIERNMLKEKVKILEKKVEALDSANDVLLEKNAKLRASSKRSPDRKRSPDKEHRGRRDRRDRDRSRDKNRSRSKERARSKDQVQESGNWKDNNNRGGGGGRWNNNNSDQFSNNPTSGHNNYNNRPV